MEYGVVILKLTVPKVLTFEFLIHLTFSDDPTSAVEVLQILFLGYLDFPPFPSILKIKIINYIYE